MGESRTQLTDRGTRESLVPLLERERELNALERSMDRLADGAGSLVLVEGPAGIGKTRLLAEAAELADRRELLVRRARGGELEREMPFGVARQLLELVVERASEEERSWLLAGSAALALTALGRAAPDAAPAADPFAPIHGLYWLLANLADTQPTVLVIDDAHWADAQTLRFLDYLVRRLADLPVLVLASVRSGEPDEPAELQPLRLEAELLRLVPLSQPAVAELISAHLGTEPSGEFSEACAKATAGNPFLLAEVLRSLRADAVGLRADASSLIAALGPESVSRNVLTRLGRFGSEAIALAKAIAVLGGSPQLRHAAKLAGLEEGHARGLCDRMREAEIVAPGLPLDFVHPLVRSAIYRDLSEEERSVAHRRAAEILHETGAGARAAAPHLMGCAPNGDQWVVARLGEAAWGAIRAGAHDSAQTYLERALDEPPEDELPLLHALGRCMLQTDPGRAPDILREVVERAPDERTRVRALRQSAQGHFIIGNWVEAARCHDEVLARLPDEDREQRLITEANRFLVRMGGGGRDTATSKRIQAVAAGLEGETAGECLARQALAIDLFMACAPVDEVVGLVAYPPDPWGNRTNLPAAVARYLAWSGRWDDARRLLARLAASARELGMVVTVSYYSGLLAGVDRLAGRLIDAEAEARTGFEMASALASFSTPAWDALMNLVAILVARGELDEAEAMTDAIDLGAGPREIPVAPWPIEVRAHLRLARGELEAAVDDLLELGEAAESWGYLNPAIPPWRQEVVPALAAMGRTAEGSELISEAERRARAFGAAHVIGTVLRSRASLEPRRRQIATLRESVTALDIYGPPHELARSLVELGAALRRDGQRTESREPLRRALELAHRCGAGGIESRAREELAAAGSRPRSAVRTGVASLTASELRTAKLAAAGLNNREIAERLFVTRRTVETHLTHAYQKLDITRRSELATALADDPPVER